MPYLPVSRSSATRRCISPCPSITVSPVSWTMADAQRRVFLHRLLKRGGKLDVVLALRRGDRRARAPAPKIARSTSCGGGVLAGRERHARCVRPRACRARPSRRPRGVALGGVLAHQAEDAGDPPDTAFGPGEFGACRRPSRPAPARSTACRRAWCAGSSAPARPRRPRRGRAARGSRRCPEHSWRIAFSRRPTPLAFSAEPISTGQIARRASPGRRSLKTLVAGGWMSSSSCSISPSS